MQRIQTICLVILTIIAGGFALHYLQSVLLPFVIAFFIVSGCRPILDYLEGRFHLHWILSFAVTFGIGVVLLAGFSFLAWLSIHDLSSHFPAFEKRVAFITNWISEKFPDEAQLPPESETPNETSPDSSSESRTNSPVQNPSAPNTPKPKPADDRLVSERAGESGDDIAAEQDEKTGDERGVIAEEASIPVAETVNLQADLEALAPDLTQQPTVQGVDRSILRKPSEAMKRMFESLGNYAQSFLLSFAGTLTSLLSSAILILIYVFFLLLGRAEANKDRIPIVKAIDDQVRKYIVMKTVISAITGLATWFVLWLFGVPLAIVFGLLTFLINFIPNIGPVIISLLPLPFLVLNPEMNIFVGLLVFCLIASIQFISGNVIETRLMGKSFDVNPVVLLLALMFFGLIWGIPGMFLATPIVSVLKIVLQQRETTRPFADMLAGRWDGRGLSTRV